MVGASGFEPRRDKQAYKKKNVAHIEKNSGFFQISAAASFPDRPLKYPEKAPKSETVSPVGEKWLRRFTYVFAALPLLLYLELAKYDPDGTKVFRIFILFSDTTM